MATLKGYVSKDAGQVKKYANLLLNIFNGAACSM